MNFKEIYFNEKLNGDGSNIKDNYHSMSELYFHRMCLFAVLCKTFSDKSWKSKLHHDGKVEEVHDGHEPSDIDRLFSLSIK